MALGDLDESAFEAAHQLVVSARRIAVLTGAGISTDSGIPDFRGPNGVWTKDPAAEKASTLQYWLSDPEVRRRGWQLRLEAAARTVEPNVGHRALVELERQGRLVALITQNVDGLHIEAGSSPDLVIEVHGSGREAVCMHCGDRRPMATALDRVRAGEADPPCLVCGGILKSATISFGQSLVEADLERADEAARSCDLLLAIGSTLAVYPVANVVPVAKAHGADIVILNGEATAMDELADVVVQASISDVLPRLVELA